MYNAFGTAACFACTIVVGYAPIPHLVKIMIIIALGLIAGMLYDRIQNSGK